MPKVYRVPVPYSIALISKSSRSSPLDYDGSVLIGADRSLSITAVLHRNNKWTQV